MRPPPPGGDPRGVTQTDRGTRIGLGPMVNGALPWPLRGLSPAGDLILDARV